MNLLDLMLTPEQKEMNSQLANMARDHFTGPELEKMNLQQRLLYMTHCINMTIEVMAEVLPDDGFALFKRFVRTKLDEATDERKDRDPS